jgi:alpha-mannosidase
VTAAATPAKAARAAQRFNRPVEWMAAAGGDGSLAAMGSLVSLDGEGVITALKPAERGEGVIVRALLLPGPATLTTMLPHTSITKTDALERDLSAIEQQGPGTSFALDHEGFGAIATVRLH